MASFVLEYDPAGDVQLILEGKFGDRFDIGPLGVSMGKVQLRTSSEKLISSSRYFKAMFERSRFSEAMELEEHGSIEIPLSEPEDDPTAMMIVLGILHNDQFFLLRDMDLWLLDRLATLVDKYEWHALVTPRARMSFDSLVQSKGLPHRFDQDLLKWLWISWVFGIKDHFKTLSRVAQQDACQPINLEDRNIRLPTSVLSKYFRWRSNPANALTSIRRNQRPEKAGVSKSSVVARKQQKCRSGQYVLRFKQGVRGNLHG